MTAKAWFLPMLLLMLAQACWAQAAGDESGAIELQDEAMQRDRIRAERANEQARFAQQEALCYQKFAVNQCLAEQRRTRRELLTSLRRQETLLNDAQRKRMASAQLLRLDAKPSQAP